MPFEYHRYCQLATLVPKNLVTAPIWFRCGTHMTILTAPIVQDTDFWSDTIAIGFNFYYYRDYGFMLACCVGLKEASVYQENDFIS